MQSGADRIVIIGTGGTIAGASGSATDNVGYKAGQLSVDVLLQAIPALDGRGLEAEQLAQLDSKDMNHDTWARLARRVQSHLDRPDVQGVVITHGTDTLEETAQLLHRVLSPRKPVVLTAAMRPATAVQADGPQNMLDAIALARTPDVHGVLVAVAGQVWSGPEVRKVHSYRLDAFAAGADAGPLAVMEEGAVRQFRAWPSGDALGVEVLPEEGASAADWPWVAVVPSHAGLDGRALEALQAAGVQGVVLACTGNGTFHEALERPMAALREAGIPVWRTTRCAGGPIVRALDEPAATLSPWAARVALMLELLRAARAAAPTKVA